MRARGCTVAGCTPPAHQEIIRGLCPKHYQQQRRADAAAARPPKAPRLCDIEGCGRPHLVHGLCDMHRCRLRTRGTTDDPYPRACTVNGCSRPFEARGMCAMHYQRWRAETAPRCTYPRGCHRPRHNRAGLCQTHARWEDRRAKHATLSAEVASWGYTIDIPLEVFVRFHDYGRMRNRRVRGSENRSRA